MNITQSNKSLPLSNNFDTHIYSTDNSEVLAGSVSRTQIYVYICILKSLQVYIDLLKVNQNTSVFTAQQGTKNPPLYRPARLFVLGVPRSLAFVPGVRSLIHYINAPGMRSCIFPYVFSKSKGYLDSRALIYNFSIKIFRF